MTITEAQKSVSEWAARKGWNKNPIPVPEMCALLHSEVSEALESFRDHEPLSWTSDSGKPMGVGSEFADTLIRLLHYSEYLGINLEDEYLRKMTYNETREYRHGGKAC